MRSWLRPELAVRLGVDDAVGPQLRREPRRRRVVEVDGRGRRGCARRAWRRTASRLRVRLGPAVEDLGRAVAAARGPLEPAVGEHPVELVGEQEQRRERGRVVGLVEAGVLERDREVERRRHPAVRRRDALDARRRRGRAQREPQPAVAAEALLRREVVDVELRRDRRAGRRRPTWRRRARARRGVAPPGRRTSVITPVEVSLCGYAYTSTSASPRELGVRARARDSITSGRRGAARRGRRRRTSTRTRRSTRCSAAALDEPERGRVPERGGAAVAEQDLVAVGEREEVGEAVADTAHDRAHAVAAVAGARGSRRRRPPSAATASVRTFDGPDPKRPSAGEQLGREARCRGRHGEATERGAFLEPLGVCSPVRLLRYQAGRLVRAQRGDRPAGHAAERVADRGARRRCGRAPRSRCRTRTSRARTSRRCASRSENGSNHCMIEPVASITTTGAGDERGVELLAGVELPEPDRGPRPLARGTSACRRGSSG